MSETILKILLRELATIRLVCKQCGTAVEMAINCLGRRNDVKRRWHEVCCPGCGITIRRAGNEDRLPPVDALDRLIEAWDGLDAMSGNFEVQFVVSVKADQ